VAVTIDGAAPDPAAIQYAGVAPLNAGLYQLNILPATSTNGDHTIAMTVSVLRSPGNGYISVGAIPAHLRKAR